MNTKSIWSSELKFDNVKKLESDITCDILIIGGGITGLSIANSFLNDKFKVCVVEKNVVGSGITSKSTAKITYLQDGMYSKISKYRNEKSAKLYYQAEKEAIEKITNIIVNNNIECDLKKCNSYLFTKNKKDVEKIKHEKELLVKFGEDIKDVNELPDGLKIKYGIMGENTYVFHPIKYLNALKNIIQKQIPVYENTSIINIIKKDNYYISKTKDYEIKSKIIIMCTHYPYFLFPYLMPLKCSLEKSYIGIFKDNSNVDFQGITYTNPYLSIRYLNHDNSKYKLLLTNSKNLAYHQNDMENFMPILLNKPDYVWSNIDIITKDYLPYIGLIDKNFYIATGYNTWGFTNATLASIIIHDLVNGKENKYEKITNPKRSNNLNIDIKYPLYCINNMYSFLSSKLIKNKSWYSKNVYFKNINGENIGIYKDKYGKEYMVKNKCPHLGCSLIFNEVELTWDCPCHGSRFDINGKVIEGPSNYDISVDKKS